ncbi:FAD-dependent thymidylate synthase [Streptomyces sp. NPDC102381]|uniref:FAD-dependent thymidylate synthase n=1 Tax=Streptomyces sp. NPDC102381 TaxID=3366164 RepID=UPI003826D0DE
MKVDVLASSGLRANVLRDAYGYATYTAFDTMDADALGEAAGRICYKSFSRPNPDTAPNAAYLGNILTQGHYSVLEHAHVSFLVRHVSRSLLTELSRHRHLSFSVVSQRYVDYSKSEPVVPPAMRGTELEEPFRVDYAEALEAYEAGVKLLRARGHGRKQAREAARALLPNAAPVDMVVSGNLRAWRDVLGKRWHVAADTEIREFAGHVLRHLRDVAPNSVQDVPESPYE